MKEIIQTTERYFSKMYHDKIRDLVKVRLRGKGSGYYEGLEKIGKNYNYNNNYSHTYSTYYHIFIL